MQPTVVVAQAGDEGLLEVLLGKGQTLLDFSTAPRK